VTISETRVQLFTIPFQQPIQFAIAISAAGLMMVIFLRSAMSAEGRPSGWVRALTSPNGKVLFGFLFILWAVVSGLVLGLLVPHQGADSPYGGFALISLFAGFFIMMGFLWSVIGE